MKQHIITLFALAALLVAGPVMAADSLLVCQPGVPFVWGNGGAAIPFNPDQGDLSTVFGIDNAAGTAIIQSSFDTWGNLPQASVSYVNTGQLPVDVDITNFQPWLDGIIGDGLSPIVFDATGEIFDLLFGPGSGILGFAGPEAGITATCEITEGLSFLNGAAFDDLQAVADVTVHEFGHYSNLGHVELNGHLIAFAEGGDDTGPTPDNATFPAPATFLGLIDTMYPLYFGPGSGTATPHADDIASLATLYPAPGFASSVGTITGTVFAPNGDPLSGVNVIARNVADPFADAVSTFSGAYTDGADPSTDPNVGVFSLTNLTPGATYLLFVDTVTAQAGRFSNPIVQPLPAPEEYWNGALESSDSATDDPQDSTPIVLSAGQVFQADIFLNAPPPGAIDLGDDDFAALPLPFDFEICGQEFNTVFVNSNGNLTFGAGSTDFSETVGEFLTGPPRIAGVYDDLSPNQGGVIRFEETNNTFTVFFEGVPEFLAGNDNTFSIELNKGSNLAVIRYDNVDAADGIAGLSCGSFVTNEFEVEENLRNANQGFVWKTVVNEAARFENFSDGDNDLDNLQLTFQTLDAVFTDYFENNNTLNQARWIGLP
ncbi:MAG: carboxypeptidase-like regulatory domain-containing protein, partial [Acidobacteriota bacterium]